jgi:CubicO group peptidase (beta-lactamase class C family)
MSDVRDSALESAVAAAAEAVGGMTAAGTLTGAVVAAVSATGAMSERAVGVTRDGRAIRTSDRFLTTSITKAITAIQVMRAVDRGDLDLWSRVDEHLPAFRGEGKEAVLVHHLLSHTSGLSQRANVIEGPPTDLDAEALEAYAIATPLSRPPGLVEYCSPGFWLLAAILRRCVGRDHVDDLTDLAGSIGLLPDELGYVPGDTPPTGLVPPIVSRNTHLAEQVRRIAYPAGGVVATGSGLARLGAAVAGAHQRGGILSPAAVDAMARPWSEGKWPDGRPAVWGLGVELVPPGDLMGSPTLFHAGASGVGLWVDLERGVALTLLTADWYAPRTVHARVANAFAAGLTGSIGQAGRAHASRYPHQEERP